MKVKELTNVLINIQDVLFIIMEKSIIYEGYKIPKKYNECNVLYFYYSTFRNGYILIISN